MRDLSKRLFDLAVAGTTLLASAPLLALASVAIKLESAGPVVFRQTRVGRDKRPFQTLKLRTMVADAERRGPAITSSSDLRITRVGRWLRRTKLDELPQLWNVLRGDMSIVGPRPEVPQYVALYRADWQRLFDARPGITDLASLTFRDEEALLAAAHDRDRAYREVIMPLKLSLALEDLERASVAHDLGVVVRTLLAVANIRSPRQEAVLARARRAIAELA